MDTLAERVHCSRATIYRYAGNKSQIRDVVLVRIATAITDAVRREVEDLAGPERVVTAIAVALRQVRASPLRRSIVTSGKVPELSDLHSSPVLSALAAELTGISDGDRAAAVWIVHVVMSMAYLDIGDEDLEAEILQRFVFPAFDTGPGHVHGVMA